MIPTKIALVLLLAVQWGHCSIWIIRPSPQPPQPDEVAKMARYIMRNSGTKKLKHYAINV
jgi:hypothetical protein